MKGIKIHILMLSVVCGLMSGSCEFRPLENPDDIVNLVVKINTDSIRNITSDIYNPNINVPDVSTDMMRFIFYDATGERISFDTYLSNKKDVDGKTVITGQAKVLPGKYRAVSYNFDVENTLIKNDMNFNDITASPLNVSENISKNFRLKSEDKDKMFYEPDHLLVAIEDDITIPYHKGLYNIETEARSVVETYYLQIKVKGLQYVSSAQAMLSGMTVNHNLTQRTKVQAENTAVYFNLQKSKDKDEDVIAAVFSTFGRADKVSHSLRVFFTVRTTEGKTVRKDYDITDLFKTEECIKHNWLLLDEIIEIDPPEKPATGGFDPTIKDWDEETVEIDL